MERIQFVFKFMKNVVYGLVLEGILTIVIGVLIFAYPNLLGMLVGLFLVITGIVSLLLAAKVNKYSRFEIEL